jgi:DNA-directed RNA polymerase subunit M/transcription elongation factor TFIIS
MEPAFPIYECVICKKVYPTKGNLDRHNKTDKHLNRVRKEKHNEEISDIEMLREEHRFEIERLKDQFKKDTQLLRENLDCYKAQATYWEKQYKELSLFKK